jgi:hypothetical protein
VGDSDEIATEDICFFDLMNFGGDFFLKRHSPRSPEQGFANILRRVFMD